ncbi:MAG TPA: energy transducer TonB [Terriglobales bacterium]|nr:energy transducer TonB [Terriglobales bacterium]
MSSPRTRWLAAAWLVVLGWMALGTAGLGPTRAWAGEHEEQLTRKVKSKTAPAYPDMARRMSISGTVRVLVVVTPSGAIKSTKVLGGHPLLVNAALDALKRWKFEPGPDESSGVVEFRFQPEE